MGKTVTPTYRLEIYERARRSSMAWSGKPSQAALAKYIRRYIKSLQKGGVNYHISLSLGHIPIPTKARIVRQKTGDVVTTWVAPSFMAI